MDPTVAVPDRRKTESGELQFKKMAAVARAASDTGEVLQMLLPEVGRVMPCRSLGFFTRQGDSLYDLIAVASNGALSGVEHVSLPVTLGHLDDSHHMVSSTDNGSSAHPVFRWLGRHGLATTLSIPVVHVSAPVGWLVAGRAETHPFRRDDVRQLVELAQLVAPILSNVFLRQKLERVESELDRAKSELARTERLAMQMEMAYGAAHDINNILGLISATSDLLRIHDLPPAAEASLDAIQKAVDDGTAVVRRITQFAKRQPGRATVRVDLGSVVEEAIEMTRPRWQPSSDRKVAVQVHFEEARGHVVVGNASELREVVVNLIMNALDAMPDGGDLDVSVRSEGKSAVLSVADTGKGMSEAVRQQLFQPFFSTKKGTGHGLGLWVSQGIAVRHGGEIAVQSELSHGATFTVGVPLAATAPQSDGGFAASGRGHSILIVDDEAGLADALKLGLESAGYWVVAATDGKKALQLFKDCAFDLVITDLRMPGLTGTELAKAIRAIRPSTPIVGMTGWPVGLMEGTTGENFEMVLQKPCRVKDLKATVARVLARKARAQEVVNC